MDSGCTDHIVTHIDAFLDFVPTQSGVRSPNGDVSFVVGRGCVRISISPNKGELQCELKNVLSVPDYSSNLLSVSRCTEWGRSFTFGKGTSCMKLQKKFVLSVGTRQYEGVSLRAVQDVLLRCRLSTGEDQPCLRRHNTMG